MVSLASVVKPAKIQLYTNSKVDDDHPLTQFHKKFLGKSMEKEAERQKTQTQIGGQPEDEDQDKYEATEEDQGKGKGKAIDEGGDEVMNKGEGKLNDDEGDATDEDDDILPGCYVLDIDIDGMTPKSLWIRADYIRIFNYLQIHYDKYAKPKNRAPSAVLTGQPGIGKSCWIYYAARRLLAEMRPFIWLYGARYHLFVDDGVYELPPNWSHFDFTSIIWTLVDADQSRADVPEYLIPHGTRLFVMYVTSPAADRWSRMDKTTYMIVVVMNPWGRREIQRVACLSSLEGITEAHVNRIFDELGPIPCLCIDQAPHQLAQYRNQLHQAISNITADDIQKLTNEASELTMDAVSQKICLLSRQRRDVVYSRVVVAPITDSITSRLSIQFQTLQQAEQLRLYQVFEKAPHSRRIAGIFYEAMAQSRLQNGMHLELVPMVKLEEKEGSKTRSRWCSSYILMRNPSLEAAQQQAAQRHAVKIQPKKTLDYTDDGLQSIEANVFYVPALNNRTAFGSFMLLDGLLYIFQITTASSHDINQGLITVANRFRFPSREKWRFVFIIPPNQTLSVPQPWKLDLRSLSPFTAVVRADEASASTKMRKST